MAFYRLSDVTCAAAGLLLLMPVLAVLALAILWDDGPPVFFSQTRVGRKGKPFRIWKFRTMRAGSQGSAITAAGDGRVTRAGAVLRRFKLDELPQLFNVLRGEMSLVGPRPVPVYEAEEFKGNHWKRLMSLPGITGLWQVEGRCLVGFEEAIDMDLDYVRRQSMWLDIKLLLLTIPAILSGRGAG
jgi:lipopolysaccharide/colanic/teichoic acid biosynthesis glycosyltransferase